MPQVLNVQDRSSAFWKFLLFFLITIAVVIFAVYFDYRMPWVQNKTLKEEVQIQREYAAQQDRFVNKLQEMTALMDSVEKNPALQPQLQSDMTRISQQLNDLTDLQLSQGSGYTKLQRQALTLVAKISTLRTQKDELKEEKARTQQLLDDCNRNVQNSSMSFQ